MCLYTWKRPVNKVRARCPMPCIQLGPAIKAYAWMGVLSRDLGYQAGQLTYEWLHCAVDMFVLFEARGCGEGFAAVGAGMGPGTNVL